MNYIKLILIFVTVSALSACSTKPPGCGEQRSIESVTGLIMKQVRQQLTGGEEYKGDPAPIDSFMSGLKLSLTMITTDGYDDKAKKHECHGQLAANVMDKAGQFNIDFSTQTMEDKHDDFVVSVAQGQSVIDQIKKTGVEYWSQQRFVGEWHGVYSCEAIDGENSGAKAGFKQDVTMNVASGAKAQLERTTRGGGVEQLAGRIDFNNRLDLRGIGRNSPDDTWRISFVGDAEPNAINAVGQLMDANSDRVFRNCLLNLTRGATVPAATVSANKS